MNYFYLRRMNEASLAGARKTSQKMASGLRSAVPADLERK